MKNTQDLLHGNIKSELIALTIPLVLGNILQQFYNTIDSFIVGRYVGTEAFAGIGVAGSIMNLFIFILNGGCNGMSIIFAELYGQKNYEKLRKESFLSLSAGGGFTIVLSIVSLLVWLIFRSFLSDFLPPSFITGALQCSGLPEIRKRRCGLFLLPCA